LALHDALQISLDRGLGNQEVHNVYSRMRTILVASLTRDEHYKGEAAPEKRDNEAFNKWLETQEKKVEMLESQNDEIRETTKAIISKDPKFLTLKADELREYEEEEVRYPRKGGRPPPPTMPGPGKHHGKKR
jgi:hypothetical protein